MRARGVGHGGRRGGIVGCTVGATAGGSFPHNTSGGQLSAGQAGAAGGYLGFTESIRQLTGTPIGNPVKDAELALVSGFGMINYDRGLSSGAAVLARAS